MEKEQAERHNQGKPQLSYLLEFPLAGAALASVLEFGAEKYARGNWKKGMPKEQVIDSLLRHLTAYTNGELLDPESGLPHVGHVAANVMFLAEFELRWDYKEKKTSSSLIVEFAEGLGDAQFEVKDERADWTEEAIEEGMVDPKCMRCIKLFTKHCLACHEYNLFKEKPLRTGATCSDCLKNGSFLCDECNNYSHFKRK